MIGDLCRYLKRWFDEDSRHNRLPSWNGEFTISGGEIIGFSDRLKEGQHFRIFDSVLNDGVYLYPTTELIDETFNGFIQSMRVPRDLIKADQENDALRAKVIELGLLEKGYASEAFGGYSYQLFSGAPPMMIEQQKDIMRRIDAYRWI